MWVRINPDTAQRMGEHFGDSQVGEAADDRLAWTDGRIGRRGEIHGPVIVGAPAQFSRIAP